MAHGMTIRYDTKDDAGESPTVLYSKHCHHKQGNGNGFASYYNYKAKFRSVRQNLRYNIHY